jgi:polyhydroxyalkanoate synthase
MVHEPTTSNDTDVKLNNNLKKLEELTRRLVGAVAGKKPKNQDLQGPDSELYSKAASAWMSEAMRDPSKLIEQQVGYWGETLKYWSEAQNALLAGEEEATSEAKTKPQSQDRRFKNPLWESHPYFKQAKQQYLLNVLMMEKSVNELEGLSQKEQKQVEFFTKQILDLYSPANFLATNPDALEKAVETEGQSLIDGLENLVRDLETNHGELTVTLADPDAFEVGVNIATTPGSVVFQNRMFQFIQYTPTTEKVQAIPLVIFPPWINKFYILDLKEKNSLIKFAVDQGFTVFVVSWVNPDETYRDVGFDHYITEGLFKAVEVAKEITGEKQVNVIGYCIAGTLLTIGLAHMAAHDDKSIKCATYFTALTDFEDSGDLGVFIDDGFLAGIEREVDEKGYLSHSFMSQTFSYLRANDLVYGPAIRSYMMGEAPPAFDLLYWNGDSTNLPARMAKEYLSGLYRDNKLCKGEFEVLGEKLDMTAIKTPMCVIATKSDHIAPWKSSFRGLNQTSGQKKFVLAQSGHIAGIVNPARGGKYGHWTNKADPNDLDKWFEDAEFYEGSWWNNWASWLKRRSGKKIAARQPGTKKYPVIEAAPGSYVKTKAV